MNLSTIIEKKKEEFVEKYYVDGHFGGSCFSGWEDTGDEIRDTFLEKAIRESVEEALREVRPEENYTVTNFNVCLKEFDSRVKEFMK